MYHNDKYQIWYLAVKQGRYRANTAICVSLVKIKSSYTVANIENIDCEHTNSRHCIFGDSEKEGVLEGIRYI